MPENTNPAPRPRNRRSDREVPVASLTTTTHFKAWDPKDGKDHQCAKYVEQVAPVPARTSDLFSAVKANGNSGQVLSGKALYPMYDAMREEFLAHGVTVMPTRAEVIINFYA